MLNNSIRPSDFLSPSIQTFGAGEGAGTSAPMPVSTMPYYAKPKSNDPLLRITDSIQSTLVGIGNWWNEWQNNNPTTNYTKDLAGGLPGMIDDINANDIKNGIPVSASRSLLGTAGKIFSNGLNAVTGSLDLLGAFAKDTQEQSSGLRTAVASVKAVGSSYLGYAVGAGVLAAGASALPAIAIGLGTAAAGKFAFDYAEDFAVNSVAPWIRSWF